MRCVRKWSWLCEASTNIYFEPIAKAYTRRYTSEIRVGRCGCGFAVKAFRPVKNFARAPGNEKRGRKDETRGLWALVGRKEFPRTFVSGLCRVGCVLRLPSRRLPLRSVSSACVSAVECRFLWAGKEELARKDQLHIYVYVYTYMLYSIYVYMLYSIHVYMLYSIYVYMLYIYMYIYIRMVWSGDENGRTGGSNTTLARKSLTGNSYDVRRTTNNDRRNFSPTRSPERRIGRTRLTMSLSHDRRSVIASRELRNSRRAEYIGALSSAFHWRGYVDGKLFHSAFCGRLALPSRIFCDCGQPCRGIHRIEIP